MGYLIANVQAMTAMMLSNWSIEGKEGFGHAALIPSVSRYDTAQKYDMFTLCIFM